MKKLVSIVTAGNVKGKYICAEEKKGQPILLTLRIFEEYFFRISVSNSIYFRTLLSIDTKLSSILSEFFARFSNRVFNVATDACKYKMQQMGAIFEKSLNQQRKRGKLLQIIAPYAHSFFKF